MHLYSAHTYVSRPQQKHWIQYCITMLSIIAFRFMVTYSIFLHSFCSFFFGFLNLAEGRRCILRIVTMEHISVDRTVTIEENFINKSMEMEEVILCFLCTLFYSLALHTLAYSHGIVYIYSIYSLHACGLWNWIQPAQTRNGLSIRQQNARSSIRIYYTLYCCFSNEYVLM